MASSLASDKPSLPAPGVAAHDPFVTSTPAPARGRYANFDHDLFIAGPASSPGQAKRALEAHLAETERRLEEAGKLGTALVSQRKALTEQLQEVEKVQAEGELGPELRQKLVEIEKEYNNLARESARAFLPKQRVPSNEVNPNSPFAPDSRGGRRSVSPSKFESQATGSPTKLSVPNRKIRNQPSNRVHDIEFAAEISTSLIAQVRNLQALLAERDEEVKDLKFDKSRLEIDSENLKQRAKTLDESENRYKEENWNLETKLQELATQHKEASDREKKLTQTLNTTKTEKVTAQRDLDEVKVTHARLIDEYAAAVRNHDIELGTAKRKIGMAEGERAAMQRRIDDLTSQNQELARAFSVQRARVAEQEANTRTSDEDFESAADHITPEHSPPQSPVKGTPRHSVLETETMKSSLHHAQRTIQSQRSLLHREKTEKLELRRIIQDLRDDLEKARSETTETKPARRSRNKDSKEFKKPPRLLGSFRSSKQEVIPDDGDWEDQGDVSPRTAVSPMTSSTITVRRRAGDSAQPTDASDHFDTANEASESAFETANERGTETEDFQTVNEELSGSDGAETETEVNTRSFSNMKPPSLPSALSRHASRHSINSTASTSADEDDYAHIKTPTGTISSQRSSRFRVSRSLFSRSRQASEEPTLQSSPVSFMSSPTATPQGGQSLFAELQQDLDGSDSDSAGVHTPSRRGARSVTPGSVGAPFSPPPPMPVLRKALMVDSGVMTDPVNIVSSSSAIESSPRLNVGLMPHAHGDSPPSSPVSVVARPRSTISIAGSSRGRAPSWSIHESIDESRPISMSYSDAGAQHDPDMEEKLAQFPVPPSMLSPIIPPSLSISTIAFEDIEPREEIVVAATLSLTVISNESVEPVAEPEAPMPDLSLTAIIAENLEPVAEPEAPMPDLSLTAIVAENLEPVEEPSVPPPDLSVSHIFSEDVEPVAEPEVPLPELSMTTILVENVEPVAEPEIPPPDLSLSGIFGEIVEPVAEPLPDLAFTRITVEELHPIAEPAAPLPDLTLTTLIAEELEPIAEPESPVPELSFASIAAEELEPLAEPMTPPPELTFTSLLAEKVEPVEEPSIPPPQLCMSFILGESVEPVAEPEVLPIVVAPPPPALSMSTIFGEHIEPVNEPEPVLVVPELGLSTISSEHFEPIAEPAPLPALRPQLSMSNILREHVEPISEPAPEPFVPPVPALSMSFIMKEHVEPISEPEPVLPEAPALSMSFIIQEHVEPIAEPAPPAPLRPQLSMSNILREHVEPIAEPELEPVLPPAPQLSMSSILQEHVEPIAEPEPEPIIPPVPQLSLSSILGEHVAPIAEPEPELVLPPVPELSLSTILGEHVAPVATPDPELSLSTIFGEHVAPIAEPEPEVIVPELSFSVISREHVEPISEPEPELVIPELVMSTIQGEHVEPIAAEPAELALSTIATQEVEPVVELEKVTPRLSLKMSSIFAEHCEPREEPQPLPTPVELVYSSVSIQDVVPVSEPEPLPPSLGLSSIAAENISPILAPDAPLPSLAFSPLAAEGIEPIAPIHKRPSLPSFGFSSIESIETQPISPRSPWRDGFVLPRDMKSPLMESDFPETPANRSIGRNGKQEDELIIAEDETRQSLSDPREDANTPESQRPFKEISTNQTSRPRKASIPTSDQGAQTSLTADAIDAMFKTRGRPSFSPEKMSVASFGTPGTTGTSGTVRIHRPRDSYGSPTRKSRFGEDAFDSSPVRRPDSSASALSAASGRASSILDAPPLPPNHREVIEAARASSSHGTQANMGPPMWPASALKPQRPITPNQYLAPHPTRDVTPRAANAESSPTRLTSKSSVSSFASELDDRFNMHPGQMGIDPAGFGPNTDPRMIQAITQTMIGEYLWKYTRKTGRGELSENRHRRYFWVHPYTRTLYWSERDPSSAGKSELKAKSVPIEAVRVVNDDNPMPPGLHRKSLVIISPGRTIKFTCTTGQRHETWFNALSYLLIRTNTDAQSDMDEMGNNITREDVEEFNPQVGRRSLPPRPPPSLSSYNSRTTRNESPAVGMSMNIPTLTPSKNQRAAGGTLSKLSGYWKGSISGRRGRGHHSAQDLNIYEATEAHDSAEDLREMIEHQDRQSHRLENVRACCDGKHDVGNLPHIAKRGRLNNHAHSHPGILATPMGSVRSRV